MSAPLYPVPGATVQRGSKEAFSPELNAHSRKLLEEWLTAQALKDVTEIAQKLLDDNGLRLIALPLPQALGKRNGSQVSPFIGVKQVNGRLYPGLGLISPVGGIEQTAIEASPYVLQDPCLAFVCCRLREEEAIKALASALKALAESGEKSAEALVRSVRAAEKNGEMPKRNASPDSQPVQTAEVLPIVNLLCRFGLLKVPEEVVLPPRPLGEEPPASGSSKQAAMIGVEAKDPICKAIEPREAAPFSCPVEACVQSGDRSLTAKEPESGVEEQATPKWDKFPALSFSQQYAEAFKMGGWRRIVFVIAGLFGLGKAGVDLKECQVWRIKFAEDLERLLRNNRRHYDREAQVLRAHFRELADCSDLDSVFSPQAVRDLADARNKVLGAVADFNSLCTGKTSLGDRNKYGAGAVLDYYEGLRSICEVATRLVSKSDEPKAEAISQLERLKHQAHGMLRHFAKLFEDEGELRQYFRIGAGHWLLPTALESLSATKY